MCLKWDEVELTVYFSNDKVPYSNPLLYASISRSIFKHLTSLRWVGCSLASPSNSLLFLYITDFMQFASINFTELKANQNHFSSFRICCCWGNGRPCMDSKDQRRYFFFFQHVEFFPLASCIRLNLKNKCLHFVCYTKHINVHQRIRSAVHFFC